MLEDHWRAFARALPLGGHLIDLACGPGQAGGWALSERPDLDAVGVDIADVPQSADAAPRLRILGGAPLERLPFPDSSFDAVISQFGFEYGERAASCGEAARVLRPGGRGVFVMHHAQSAIGRDYAMRGEAFRKAIMEPDLIARIRRMFDLRRQGAPPSVIASADTEARERIRAAEAGLAAAPTWIEAWTHLRYLADLAASPGRYEPASAIERLEVVDAESRAWMARCEAQKSAALDEAGVLELAGRLSENGLAVDAPTVLRGDDGEVMAWRLAFARPA